MSNIMTFTKQLIMFLLDSKLSGTRSVISSWCKVSVFSRRKLVIYSSVLPSASLQGHVHTEFKLDLRELALVSSKNHLVQLNENYF